MSGDNEHTQDSGDATAGAASTSGSTSSDSPENGTADSKPAGGGGRFTRMAGESRALFDDLREWVDLRVQLVQVEIEERIEKMVNEAISMVMVVVVGLFALAFLLHGLAIWIGDALGAQQWGYLIMATVLGLITVILKTAKPDFVGGRKDSPKPALKATETHRLEAKKTASTRVGDSDAGLKPTGDAQKEGDGNG